jgi:hypothetical protein
VCAGLHEIYKLAKTAKKPGEMEGVGWKDPSIYAGFEATIASNF